jgi:zinc/manganese transport system permease protein
VIDPYGLLVAPFVEFAFMRRALVASLALSLGCAPVGVFLILRRMSLVGDALSHAILPGAAVAFLFAGLSIGAMAVGGFVAGVLTALGAGALSRITPLREDATFAAFYLVALAAGVLMVSVNGSGIDLLHLLFGSVMAVDDTALILVASVATLSVLAVAALFRGLVVESFDREFLRAAGGPERSLHAVFLVLLVANLVAAFLALGTLMAIGLMMLPAAAARSWTRSAAGMIGVATAVAIVSAYAGLVLSFALDAPAGPSVVLSAGCAYALSVLFGPVGGLVARMVPRRHFQG